MRLETRRKPQDLQNLQRETLPQQVMIPADTAAAGEEVWASAHSTKCSTARLAWHFFGKPVQDVFSGVAQFIQDCSHSRAPVLPLGSGGMAQSCKPLQGRGWDVPEAPADRAAHSPRALTSFFQGFGAGICLVGFFKQPTKYK